MEECLAVRLPDLRRLGLLQTGHLRSGHLEVINEDGTVTRIWVRVDADLDRQAWLTIRLQHRGQPLEHQIMLDPRPQPLGGYRWCALCPITGRRCKTLVLPPNGSHFASAEGLGLTYAVQSMDAYGRAHRRAQKAQARLRTMSKYTRHPTRARLWDAILERDLMLDDLMERTAEAVATGEPLMISQLSRQTRQARGRDSLEWQSRG